MTKIPDTDLFKSLCLRSFEEVEREIALVKEQARLVRQAAREITAALAPDEDDRNVHHGHHRRAFKSLTSATIIQFSDFAKNRSAASSIEYCLIASLLSLVALTVISGVGQSLGVIFLHVTAAFGG
jgi:Flp pilus assembly pilin Flp